MGPAGVCGISGVSLEAWGSPAPSERLDSSLDAQISAQPLRTPLLSAGFLEPALPLSTGLWTLPQAPPPPVPTSGSPRLLPPPPAQLWLSSWALSPVRTDALGKNPGQSGATRVCVPPSPEVVARVQRQRLPGPQTGASVSRWVQNCSLGGWGKATEPDRLALPL